MAEPTSDYIPPELNPFFERPKVERKSSWVVDLLQSAVIAIFVFIIIYLFIAIPNQVQGPSMQPNFLDGQLLLTNKITQWIGGSDFGRSIGLDYHRGDVIVFHKPNTDRDLIKRVIGLPGETVMVLGGDIYVNGKRLKEEYIAPEVRTNPGSFASEGKLISLGQDEYFVVGDNRPNSQDSRFNEYGPVKRDWLKGKVVLRYWPPQYFGIIGTGSSELVG